MKFQKAKSLLLKLSIKGGYIMIIEPRPNKVGWTDYDRGWLSALIDGEGSISFLKEIRPNLPLGCVYKPRLNIGNQNLELLKKAQYLIGGAIHKSKNDVYNLDVSANNMRRCLPELDFIVKKRQKVLIMKALNLLSERHRGRRNPTTDKERKEYEFIYKEIRRINGRVYNK
jgi:hypothetical protein